MAKQSGIARHLALSTISFGLCFAMWGLVGAFGPVFREMFSLSGTEAAFLVALPVLLGSLARIPMGMLTDRAGGRIVFTCLMCATVCPSQALAYVSPEDIERERRDVPANTFKFGNQVVKTKVFMMAPTGTDSITLDVADYIWEPRP